MSEHIRLKIDKYVNNKKRENLAPSIQQLQINLIVQAKHEYI